MAESEVDLVVHRRNLNVLHRSVLETMLMAFPLPPTDENKISVSSKTSKPVLVSTTQKRQVFFLPERVISSTWSMHLLCS
jgi:hypothetical protein